MKLFALSFLLVLSVGVSVVGQRGLPARAPGSHYVYGDVKIDEGQAGGQKAASLNLILYNEFGNIIGRQTVSSNGRYRFNDLADGRYYIIVEYENNEVTRFNIDFSSTLKTDTRQDIELQLKDLSPATKAGVVSAADNYDRPLKNVNI